MRIFLLLAGALLSLDTLLLSFVSNGNLGTWLPALLGAPLLAMGAFYEPWRAFLHTPAGHALKLALIAGYALFVLVVGGMSLFLSRAARKPPQDADVLIVLGCAVRGERVSRTLRYRLDTALDYLAAHPQAQAIVSGGQGEGEHISEARAMAEYLIAHGVAHRRVTMEDQSASTWENFGFCKTILDEKFPGASVAFVTTGFHVYRAGRVAAMHGIDASGIGAPDIWYSAPNNYMRESLAVMAYRLLGMLK